MGYTSLGEQLRILRIKHHEVMGDMAAKLNVSTPFLSAVENGKKNVPKTWEEDISNLYQLSESERVDLNEAIAESQTQYKIPAGNAGVMQRRAALQFARSFDDMDEETAGKILELLNRQEGGD